MTTLDASKLKRIMTMAGAPEAAVVRVPPGWQAIWKAAQAEQREEDSQKCRTAPIKTARQDQREACAEAILANDQG